MGKTGKSSCRLPPDCEQLLYYDYYRLVRLFSTGFAGERSPHRTTASQEHMATFGEICMGKFSCDPNFGIAKRLFKDLWVGSPQPVVMPECVQLETFGRSCRWKRLARLAA